MFHRQLPYCLLCLLLISVAFGLEAADADHAPGQPRISLIIDDIGYRLNDDRRAIALPGPLAYAVLPHTPYARRMATLAFSLDKDILVHLPMEALHANHLLGPGALTRNMDETEFTETIYQNIDSIPHAIGISNHMGSLLTTSYQAMRWLMRTINSTGLFYMDSFTVADSVADESALQYRVPYLRRDVFLDDTPEPAVIRARFQELIQMARDQGSAIGIGHPHPQTIDTLAELLPELQRSDVQLISIREMLELRSREVVTWQSSSSR